LIDHEASVRAHVLGLLTPAADRIVGGELLPEDPLDLIVQGESISVTLVRNHHGSLLVHLEAFVDDVHPSVRAALDHWISSVNGLTPFGALRVDSEGVHHTGTERAVLLVSHTLLAEPIAQAHIDTTPVTGVHTSSTSASWPTCSHCTKPALPIPNPIPNPIPRRLASPTIAHPRWPQQQLSGRRRATPIGTMGRGIGSALRMRSLPTSTHSWAWIP
jgi:hypothetical protein